MKKRNNSSHFRKVRDVDLLEQRVLYIDGDIDDDLAQRIIESLIKLDMVNHKDITMYINSGGGSVTSGLAIYDAMNMVKSDISTVCIGRCASMASILLINGAKDKRFILPNGEIMVHEVSSYSSGKVTEMQDKLDHSKSLNYKLWKIIASKTKKSMKDIKREATRKDSWMTATAAVKYGFVDKVIY